jgi:putative addiction module CopG family antidote
MRTTKAVSVTLPNEMVRMIKSKVASGDYASESEVVREGLRALQARDVALERFLRQEVAKGYDDYKPNPDNVVSAAQITAALDARHRARRAKTRKK